MPPALIFTWLDKRVAAAGSGTDIIKGIRSFDAVAYEAEEKLGLHPGSYEFYDEYGKVEAPEDLLRAMRMAGDDECILEVRELKHFQRIRELTTDNAEMKGRLSKLEAMMKVLDDVVGKEIQHADEKTETLRIEIEKAVNESNGRIALTKDLRSIIKAGEDKLKATADLIRQAVQTPDSALVERLEAAGIEAQALSDELQSFAEKKAKGIAQLLINAKGPGLLEMKTMSSKLTKLSSDLKQVSTNGEGIVKEGKVQLERKSLSAAATQRIKEVFEKYDADSDGFLSRKEVTKYSKGQFKFNPPADCLDRIWRNLVEGTKGISLKQFQQLKVAIGTARVLAREEAKKADKTADT